VGFVNAIKTCLRKYVTFSGRATRSEFWWSVIFLVLVNLALMASQAAFFGPSETHSSVLDTGLGVTLSTQVTRPTGPGGLLYFWISMLLLLALAPPSWAVTWRRLHDTGRTGWSILLPPAIFVLGLFGTMIVAAGSPIVFPVMLLLVAQLVIWPRVVLTRPSEAFPNEYGPNPLEVTS
jgi:uncharacterized membrane protein YhaH (DUF805 family)